jgi:hypothetical protein
MRDLVLPVDVVPRRAGVEEKTAGRLEQDVLPTEGKKKGRYVAGH